MKHSQGDEEIFILKHFKDKPGGRFLDIGAYDGKTFSNTRALAEGGWHGVLVEPSPQCFIGLCKNYEGNNNVMLVNALIGKEPVLVKFYNSGGAVATTDRNHYEKWSSIQQDFTTIYLPMLPVNELLKSVGFTFDFLSIDTEGMDFEILQQLEPFAFCNASLICIEYGTHLDSIYSMLLSHGYKAIFHNEENLICSKQL